MAAASEPGPEGYRDAPRIRTGDTIFPGFIELHNHLSYNAMPLWDVPKLYANMGSGRGIEPYTRRITKPSQVLGQTDGAAQALVRYAECRALLGGPTTSQGVTLASPGGLTKFYKGLIRDAEAPDDPRLPVADTNIANPVSGGAVRCLEKLRASSCCSISLRYRRGGANLVPPAADRRRHVARQVLDLVQRQVR